MPEALEGRGAFPQYYDDLEAGAFPHQRALCRTLEGTSCALEDTGVNPLTLRLLMARRGLEGLDQRLRPGEASMMQLQLDMSLFFTGFCTALDRLGAEVALLFGHDSGCWQDAAAPVGDRDPGLAAWLSGLHASALAPAFTYREALTHFGHIPARFDDAERRLWVASEEGPLDTDAVQLCYLLLRNGLAVINGAYFLLLRSCEENGLPPWR